MNRRAAKVPGLPRQHDGQGSDPPHAHTHALAWVSRAAAVFHMRFTNELPGDAMILKLVLWDLAYTDGRPTCAAEIAERVRIDQDTAAGALKVLEEPGIITRIPRLDCEPAYDVLYEKIPSPR